MGAPRVHFAFQIITESSHDLLSFSLSLSLSFTGSTYIYSLIGLDPSVSLSISLLLSPSHFLSHAHHTHRHVFSPPLSLELCFLSAESVNTVGDFLTLVFEFVALFGDLSGIFINSRYNFSFLNFAELKKKKGKERGFRIRDRLQLRRILPGWWKCNWSHEELI